MTFQIEWFNIESATTGKSMNPRLTNEIMSCSIESQNTLAIHELASKARVVIWLSAFWRQSRGAESRKIFGDEEILPLVEKGRREWKLRAWAESSDGGNEKRDFEADRHKVLCGSCHHRRLCFGKTNFFVEITNERATESVRRHFLQSPSGKRIKEQN